MANNTKSKLKTAGLFRVKTHLKTDDITQQMHDGELIIAESIQVVIAFIKSTRHAGIKGKSKIHRRTKSPKHLAATIHFDLKSNITVIYEIDLLRIGLDYKVLRKTKAGQVMSFV